MPTTAIRGKYLAEFSCRYDGSSKFPENSKWGFLPLGFDGLAPVGREIHGVVAQDWLDNFKIRLSAGSMGNGNIDPYKYIDYMTIKTSTVVIGDALGTSTTAPGAIPLSLTWETATTYDVGFDMDLFRNRLSIGFDWYRRYTTDMYTVGVSLPSVYGTDAPKGNNASLKTNGWELSVGWRDSFEIGRQGFQLQRQSDGLGCPHMGDRIHQPDGRHWAITTKARSWAKSGATA